MFSFSCCMIPQFLNSYWSHHMTCAPCCCGFFGFFCFTFRVLSLLVLKTVALLFLERHADWATLHLRLTEAHWNIITCMATRGPSVPNINSPKWKSMLLTGEIHTVKILIRAEWELGGTSHPLFNTRCRSHPISAVSNGQQRFTPQRVS